MASFKQHHFILRPGQIVQGKSGHRTYIGKVLESIKHPGRPAVFQRHGFVGVYVLCNDGKRRALNELRLLGG